ncbi:metallophosphoesterase [Haloarchaeobius sp. TZWWS8]|uniref:metallophosphoesterase n=1 Tax=Haloarchaeobius sp. TZWWS8 TaxID=3446121 RepID=UPI003EBB77B4
MARSEVVFRDRAAYFPAPDALVLSDLHFGRAHASNVDFPLNEGCDLIDRVDGLLERFEPTTVVLAGDVLHSFSTVPVPAREALDRLVDLVRPRAELVAVRGNHDGQLVRVFPGEVYDSFRLSDGTIVCHGHEEPAETAERYVIGHEHPAIEVEGRRYPCLLYGPGTYRGGEVFVLPCFTTLAPGVRVNRMRTGDFDSPLVVDADRFQPAIRDDGGDETLWFPELGSLRRLL